MDLYTYQSVLSCFLYAVGCIYALRVNNTIATFDHALVVDRNGREEYPIGTKIHFKCKEGYYPVGSQTAKCLFPAHWQFRGLTCHAKATPAPPPSGQLTYQRFYIIIGNYV